MLHRYRRLLFVDGKSRCVAVGWRPARVLSGAEPDFVLPCQVITQSAVRTTMCVGLAAATACLQDTYAVTPANIVQDIISIVSKARRRYRRRKSISSAELWIVP
jgi:hypothetical protein